MTRLAVAVRVRPLSEREIASFAKSIVSVENNSTVSVTNIKVPEHNAGDSRERIRRFAFDHCFGPQCSQEDVYNVIGTEISSAIRDQCHSCVLTYGQSSSGKTYTMLGLENNAGMMPRLCQNIFNYLGEISAESTLEDINVSYLEIYNEKVRDLLNPQAISQHNGLLKVREHPSKGPYVQGLKEINIKQPNELLKCLELGNTNRTVASTNANPISSRSHSIFTISCCDGLKVRLVDLAGSERIDNQTYTLSRFREGANINKSLVALRNVISALAEAQFFLKSSKTRYIPYRDSILTWLLRDTLRGNSKTILISTVSPSSGCYNETVNTLRLGQKAKQIILPPIAEGSKDATIRKLRQEISDLKRLLLLAQIPQNLGDFNKNLLHNYEEPDKKITPPNTLNDTTSPVQEKNVSWSPINLIRLKSFCEPEDNIKVKNTNNKLNNKTTLNSVYFNKSDEKVIFDEDNFIPVMDVTANVAENKRQSLPNLSETESKSFKQQVLNHVPQKFNNNFKNKNKVANPIVKKPPMEKASSSFNVLASKPEKPVVNREKSTLTDTKVIKAKIDSRRDVPPRSQIVAAVTRRLYSKVKKKEIGTDTDDLAQYQESKGSNDLKICTNARVKLQDLMRKAVKAHRRKHIETQTDLFPVRRVKETSTDVSDLQIALKEIKHVAIFTNVVETKDVGTNSPYVQIFGSNFKDFDHKHLILTRTCGTCTENIDYKPEKVPSSISFTKYLQEPKKCVQFNEAANNSSIDSLDGEAAPSGLCLPTPDLISNHNSLEHHGLVLNFSDIEKNIVRNLKHAGFKFIVEEYETSNLLATFGNTIRKADTVYEPHYKDVVDSKTIQPSFASEICVDDSSEDDYCLFACPKIIKATVIQKSSVDLKNIPGTSNGNINIVTNDLGNKSSNVKTSILNNEKVVSGQGVCDQHEDVFKAMSNFMKEATIMITNLNTRAMMYENNLEEKEYEIQVSIDDVSDLRDCKLHKSKNKVRRKSSGKKRVVGHSNCNHREPIIHDCSMDLVLNKYESLVTDSCNRLENLLKDVEENNDSVSLDSLETEPSTSRLRNYYPPSRKVSFRSEFSPSTYLQQLTNARRKLVLSTREKLLQESKNDV